VEEVTIVTPTDATSRYGDIVSDWSDATEITVEVACYPTSTDAGEDNRNRTAVIDGLAMLFFDEPPAELTHRSRVIARGVTWEVAGSTRDWRSPWDWHPGFQVLMRRVEG
jgi:hypothetical protein